MHTYGAGMWLSGKKLGSKDFEDHEISSQKENRTVKLQPQNINDAREKEGTFKLQPKKYQGSHIEKQNSQAPAQNINDAWEKKRTFKLQPKKYQGNKWEKNRTGKLQPKNI